MLRRRVRVALLGLILGMALVLSGFLWLADEWVEDAAVQDLLEREMGAVLEAGASAPQTAALRYYRPADPTSPMLPEGLRRLEPGVHEEVEADGESWRVLVREVAPGDRAYLMYLISFIEARERLLAMLAVGAIVLLLAGSATLSRRIADRALAPLEDLLSQIRRLDPDRRGQRLELDTPDSELAVIVGAINGYLGRLEHLVERERAFAAAASHELRTPLSLIRGSAEMLAAQHGAEARLVGRLQRGVREATEQLEALLALSRTRESPPVEALQLDQWLPGTAEAVLAEGDGAARVRWHCEPARLVAPPGAARIVFGNLLQNALRADAAGAVEVSIAPGVIRVEDRGPGLTADVLSQAFEPGFRGREGGSGMGLYIARAIAERYGWTLSLRNRAEGGARAEWRFPDPDGRVPPSPHL